MDWIQARMPTDAHVALGRQGVHDDLSQWLEEFRRTANGRRALADGLTSEVDAEEAFLKRMPPADYARVLHYTTHDQAMTALDVGRIRPGKLALARTVATLDEIMEASEEGIDLRSYRLARTFDPHKNVMDAHKRAVDLNKYRSRRTAGLPHEAACRDGIPKIIPANYKQAEWIKRFRSFFYPHRAQNRLLSQEGLEEAIAADATPEDYGHALLYSSHREAMDAHTAGMDLHLYGLLRNCDTHDEAKQAHASGANLLRYRRFRASGRPPAEARDAASYQPPEDLTLEEVAQKVEAQHDNMLVAQVGPSQASEVRDRRIRPICYLRLLTHASHGEILDAADHGVSVLFDDDYESARRHRGTHYQAMEAHAMDPGGLHEFAQALANYSTPEMALRRLRRRWR